MPLLFFSTTLHALTLALMELSFLGPPAPNATLSVSPVPQAQPTVFHVTPLYCCQVRVVLDLVLLDLSILLELVLLVETTVKLATRQQLFVVSV